MDTFECFNVAHFRRREKEEEKVWRFVNKRERVYHKINEEFQSYLLYYKIYNSSSQLYLIEKKIDMSTRISIHNGEYL